MIMAAAMAKLLEEILINYAGENGENVAYLCEGFSLNRKPRNLATTKDTPLTRIKNRGMIHSSRNLSVKGK